MGTPLQVHCTTIVYKCPLLIRSSLHFIPVQVHCTKILYNTVSLCQLPQDCTTLHYKSIVPQSSCRGVWYSGRHVEECSTVDVL